MIRKLFGCASGSLSLVLIALLVVELAIIGTVAAQRRVAKTSNAERVVDLFRSNCARCHGADGRGQTPTGELYKSPNFTDAEWWRKHSSITGTRSLVRIVTSGRGGMPAFRKKLKRSEITALVNYIRRFRPRN